MSDYQSVPGLDISLDTGVLTLRLARPEKRNAMDDTMMYGAIDAVDVAGATKRYAPFCSRAKVSTSARASTSSPATRKLADRASAASSGACPLTPTG